MAPGMQEALYKEEARRMVLFLWCPCVIPFPPFFAPCCPCSWKPQVKGLLKGQGLHQTTHLHEGISGGVAFRRGRNFGRWGSPLLPEITTGSRLPTRRASQDGREVPHDPGFIFFFLIYIYFFICSEFCHTLK